MKVTFLGTGTSQGVPLIGCDCNVCTSPDKRDKRLRASVLIETADTTIVIDSGPDFRYQMLRAGVKDIDALIFTHGHKDHTAGMDDIRAYNYLNNKDLDVYATEETQEVIKREFQYIFTNKHYPGIPQIELHTIDAIKSFKVNRLQVLPVKALHYRMEVLGFRIGDFTYITDANYISPEEMEKIRGSKVLVLNALRREEHISHYTLLEAISVAKESGVPEVYFTHLSHQMGLHAEVETELPPGMHIAYDQLLLNL